MWRKKPAPRPEYVKNYPPPQTGMKMPSPLKGGEHQVFHLPYPTILWHISHLPHWISPSPTFLELISHLPLCVKKSKHPHESHKNMNFGTLICITDPSISVLFHDNIYFWWKIEFVESLTDTFILKSTFKMSLVPHEHHPCAQAWWSVEYQLLLRYQFDMHSC